MREANTLLDALIDESGMSRAALALRVNQADPARQLHYDHTSVGRWIAGQRPRGPVRELISSVLGNHLGRRVTLGDIGMDDAAPLPGEAELATFVSRAPALWRSDRQDHRGTRVTPLAVGLDLIAPVWQWENLPEDSDVSRRSDGSVTAADVDQIQGARDRYEQMYRAAGGVATRPRFVGFLDNYAAPVLRGSYDDALGRRVHRAVGGLVAVAGICAYDADRHGVAQRYFHQALRLAKASGDRAFGAYVIGLLTNQALCLHDYRQAVAFAEAALRASGELSPALVSDLHGMQAKAYGRMHAGAQARAAMHLAQATADRIGQREEPPETRYVQPGQAETQLAETLLSLGDLDQARSCAQAAADQATHPRGQINRLVTVTRVALAERDVDRAAHCAGALVDLATGMESARVNDRIRVIGESLRPHDSRDAREVVDRIDHALALPL